MLGIKQDCGIKYLYTLYTGGDRVYYGIDADDTESVNDYGAVFEVVVSDSSVCWSLWQFSILL
ncbi:MAG: hypothetical protein K2P59_07255 [Acetatifactor sp.]|nr:hypothetical protein [Acetatifactor sp.]